MSNWKAMAEELAGLLQGDSGWSKEAILGEITQIVRVALEAAEEAAEKSYAGMRESWKAALDRAQLAEESLASLRDAQDRGMGHGVIGGLG
jgi:hypothetical protein